MRFTRVLRVAHGGNLLVMWSQSIAVAFNAPLSAFPIAAVAAYSLLLGQLVVIRRREERLQ